jgi:beta-N-acetylhexosaminidase
MDFAPDVDLDGGEAVSDNAIGDRAFSDDPAVVVEYGRAVIDGLLAGGVTPVIKHFPGHGHATGDSHLGTVTTPPIDQMGPDLQPFAELAQVPGVAVMVGHMQVPGFDVGDVLGAETPASLNPASYGLLRNGVNDAPGFDGVIYTDDLTGMQAITDLHSGPEAVVAALLAGADVPLTSTAADVQGSIDAIVAAVSDGRLDRGVLQQAADRSV